MFRYLCRASSFKFLLPDNFYDGASKSSVWEIKELFCHRHLMKAGPSREDSCYS